ncbi:hypothetical protein CJ179_19675 [Rhodococcus sp. ACS1]|uniref:Uncharacterized protein n=2 Tax=Rhodococcus TaxID=1827 RepID=A0A1H4Z3K7_9NOCA|nr:MULTISPECIES: hypothetical protein [Rhodococcus]KAF0959504.1 hypothetical protein MLGJGCBP_07360 [Rhodococcus sp. T7]MBV6761541.1 hypothetical protein [Rhodococcus opacus]MDF3309052.1 hypothetical protein [Rhodococcus sp. T2V]OUS89121.1 hypothetical protein CA951_37215 [Rhodococcus sp. NCIMB 12038]PBC48980.1 hypothetical protein CJ179_19675 [Rhodococcus sp. ACS1]
MIYLLALIGLVTVAVLMWKAFGPNTRPVLSTRVQGPDDDPDFLWKVDRETRRKKSDEPDAGPADPAG